MNIDKNYIVIGTLFSIVSQFVCLVFFLKYRPYVLAKKIILLPLSYFLLEIFFLLQLHSIFWADYHLEIWSGLMGFCSFCFLVCCLEICIAVPSEKTAKVQSRIYQKMPILGVLFFVSVARFLGTDRIWPLFGLFQILGMVVLMILIDGRHYLWHQISYVILLMISLGCRLLPLQEASPAVKMLPSIISPFCIGILMYIVLKLKMKSND